MRAVVQRVASASVTVGDELVSSIGKGLLVLIGIGSDDVQADIDTLTKKILTLRMWPDPKTDAAWKMNVKDIEGELLCVSQFTLMANTTKGNKPDYHRAMAPELSRAMYASVLDKLGASYDAAKIKDGRFGAMMMVSLANDGPVTFTLDSRKYEYTNSGAAGSAPGIPPPSS
ncbi:D-tyrosyl-tRNA deacylase [Clavulina sp. PMI_390]|nr:D-tyrosyl-tRNA deacylase [Clavulina sp. PMI_390]